MAFERRPLLAPGSPEERQRAAEVKAKIANTGLDPKTVARKEKRERRKQEHSTLVEQPDMTPNREAFEAVMEQVMAAERARREEWDKYLRDKESNQIEYPFDIHE